MRIRLVLLAALVVVSFAACGGSSKNADPTTVADETDDPDSDTTEGDDPSETTEPVETPTSDDGEPTGDETTVPDEDELSPLAAELAESFSSAAGADLPNEEIECLTSGILDAFEVSELIELGQDPDAAPDRDTMVRVGAVMDECVSTESLAAIFEAQGMPAEAATCVAEALGGEYTLSDIMMAGLYPDEPESKATLESIGTIGIECMA